MGLVFPAWDLRSPDRTETAQSGAGLAHFEGFLHEEPPEWRLNGGREKPVDQYVRDKTESQAQSTG
jgi:hypothetical protein